MAQLNDSMATQIMGELDGLTKMIDHLNEELKTRMEDLPLVADRVMIAAGKKAVGELSKEVAEIARKIAGDTALATRDMARLKAILASGLIIFATGILFYSAGYTYANSAAKNKITAAESKLAASELRVDQKIVGLVNDSETEIAKIRAAAGWAGTPNGKLAYNFFVNGDGVGVVNCNSPTWKKTQIKNRNFCYPQPKPLFGDEDGYGWYTN